MKNEKFHTLFLFILGFVLIVVGTELLIYFTATVPYQVAKWQRDVLQYQINLNSAVTGIEATHPEVPANNARSILSISRELNSAFDRLLYPNYLQYQSIRWLFRIPAIGIPGSVLADLDSILFLEIKYRQNLDQIYNQLSEIESDKVDLRNMRDAYLAVELWNRIRQITNQMVLMTTDQKKRLEFLIQRLALVEQNYYKKIIWVLVSAFLVILLFFVFLSIHLQYKYIFRLKPILHVSDRIVQEASSLKNLHIPHLKDPLFNSITLAFRTLIHHIARVDQVKSNILSQVTHDLKSPLSTMKQGIDILQEESLGKLNEEQKEVVELLASSYRNMAHLVNNLIDAARMEYDVLSLKISQFDMLTAAREVFEEHKALLIQKNMKIKFNFHRRKKLVMVGDRERIKDVLRNLIHNAIKFSGDNSHIFVDINLNEGDVVLIVQDFGIGIPQDEMDRIFDKLYRASNSKKMSVKGTGMGLYIVRSIVLMHKGEISVKSQPGKGTTFTVWFPRIIYKPEENT